MERVQLQSCPVLTGTSELSYLPTATPHGKPITFFSASNINLCRISSQFSSADSRRYAHRLSNVSSETQVM
ncbi:hypothetical protein FVER53590_25817 [Fusarium verticillioides]|nr:hypothetical protein FVER53263_20154 [Fusarium verticillioides]RBR03318.1 hypothetical protein FVER53590_25817 [Fusarium verticillioides]